MPYSVIIIEDDPYLRKVYIDAVSNADDLNFVGSAEDLPQGLHLLKKIKPDVMLVDIGLPSGSGIDLICYAHKHIPSCDVLVITVFGDEKHVLKCIEAGATGYLLKGMKDPEIVEQIRTLKVGGSPISPVIARQLLCRFRAIEVLPKDFRKNEIPKLSAQEHTVLEMSAKGYTYDEVASIMDLSSRTIETYVKRIYKKLVVHSKSEAIYEARQLGLLQD